MRPLPCAAALAAVLLLSSPSSLSAQCRPGSDPGNCGMGGPGSGSGPGMQHGSGGPPDGPGHFGGMHGLQVGPPGRWWDDKSFITDLGLKPEQQKRMDSIFNDNRATLSAHFQALRDEEARMDALSHSTSSEEDALFAEIDRVSQAHASLEKALTHYLLGIRRELTPDQISRLQAHQPAPWSRHP